MENIKDLICTHDLHGNILFVQPGPGQTLGICPPDMVGTNLRSYLAPEVLDPFDAYLRPSGGMGKQRLDACPDQKWSEGASGNHNTLRTEGVADATGAA